MEAVGFLHLLNVIIDRLGVDRKSSEHLDGDLLQLRLDQVAGWRIDRSCRRGCFVKFRIVPDLAQVVVSVEGLIFDELVESLLAEFLAFSFLNLFAVVVRFSVVLRGRLTGQNSILEQNLLGALLLDIFPLNDATVCHGMNVDGPKGYEAFVVRVFGRDAGFNVSLDLAA